MSDSAQTHIKIMDVQQTILSAPRWQTRCHMRPKAAAHLCQPLAIFSCLRPRKQLLSLETGLALRKHKLAIERRGPRVCITERLVSGCQAGTEGLQLTRGVLTVTFEVGVTNRNRQNR